MTQPTQDASRCLTLASRSSTGQAYHWPHFHLQVPTRHTICEFRTPSSTCLTCQKTPPTTRLPLFIRHEHTFILVSGFGVQNRSLRPTCKWNYTPLLPTFVETCRTWSSEVDLLWVKHAKNSRASYSSRWSRDVATDWL